MSGHEGALRGAEADPAPEILPSGVVREADRLDGFLAHRAVYYAANILIPLVIVLSAYLAARTFFFHDDAQVGSFDTIKDVGLKILARESPLLTLKIFNGDNYILEYQNGIFNPFNLIGAAIVASVRTADVSMTLYAGLFLWLTYGGAIFAARAFSLSRTDAIVVATAVTCLPWLIHVYARSWVPGLTGFAWFPWYAGCLALFLRDRIGPWTMLGACTSLYLLLTAGWPQGVIAAFLVTLVFAVLVWRDRGIGRLALLVVALASGALLAAPALLPLALGFEKTARPFLFSADSMYAVLLDGLLASSAPSFYSRVASFSRVPYLPIPAYYVGAFFVPLTLLAVGKPRAGGRADPSLVALLCASAAMLALILVPNYVGPFRWSMRWIPYFQFFGVLASLYLIRRAAPFDLSRRSIAIVTGYFALAFVISIRDTPQLYLLHAKSILVAAVATLAMMALSRWKALFGAMGVVVILAGYVGHARSPISREHMADFGVPFEGIKLSPAPIAGGTTLFLNQMHFWHPLAAGRLSDVAEPGNAVLNQGGRVLAGYSPVGHQNFVAFACMFVKGGHLCPQVFDRMFSVDQTTGIKIADAFKIEHVLIEQTSPWFSTRQEELRGEFEKVAENPYLIQWDRRAHNPLPGTLSVLPPGTSVAGYERFSDSHERYRIAAGNDARGGPAVFSRLSWPGYRVSLNGTPLPVGAFHDVLVMAQLPAGATGILDVEYWPRGLSAGLWSAAVGLLLILAGALLAGRSRKRSRDGAAASAGGPR